MIAEISRISKLSMEELSALNGALYDAMRIEDTTMRVIVSVAFSQSFPYLWMTEKFQIMSRNKIM